MEVDEFFYAEEDEMEKLRESRRRMREKEFGKLINKKDLSSFELDELFM